MRQRVISSLVGLAILAAVLLIINTWLFNLVMAAISLIGMFELLRATDSLKNRGLSALSLAFSFIMPFCRMDYVKEWTAELIFLFFLLFFVLLIKNYNSMKIEQAALVFMLSVFMPLFFSCAVFLRDSYGSIAGSFYLLMGLGSAWLCDTCAFFAGRKFGKHKLAPLVSPKKTVEGAIGGLIGCTVFMLLIALGFSACASLAGVQVRINYPMVALFTPVCGALGMLGDLSASVIKRQYNVKDYGTIMPGHGGVMDRFDSVLFTVPTVFIISAHVSLISVI